MLTSTEFKTKPSDWHKLLFEPELSIFQYLQNVNRNAFLMIDLLWNYTKTHLAATVQHLIQNFCYVLHIFHYRYRG